MARDTSTHLYGRINDRVVCEVYYSPFGLWTFNPLNVSALRQSLDHAYGDDLIEMQVWAYDYFDNKAISWSKEP